MAFIASKFIFDGIPSEIYGLTCAKVGSSGEDYSSSGANVTIVEDYVPRRPKPYFYGTKYEEKLQFQLQFFSEETIERPMVEAIQQWLFGHKEYKKLQILQCDMYDVYYNCILNQGSVIAVGNNIKGFQCNVICDSPWAWGMGEKYYTRSLIGESIITVTNSSDDNGYLYPDLSFYSPILQSNVKIINITDNNRESVFSSLFSGESITMKNDIKFTSSNMENLQERFNGVYLRLLRGANKLKIIGNLENITITYVPARKVGS